MVRLALIHPFLNFHEVDLNRTPVREWRQFERSDPFVDLNDREFKLQYRFSKQSVLRLVSELSPYLVDDKRKHCLSPLQQVMITLSHLAGDEFERSTARWVRCCPETVSNCIDRVYTGLEALKPKYVRLPNAQEAEASAARINDLYNIENVAYGIDGVSMEFATRPRKVMGGLHPDLFYNRKERFSLNVMAICDAFKLIRDIDVRYPGSVHDALIWNNSTAKVHLNGSRYFLAADKAYPLSETIMKPFEEPENCFERLFNLRLSQARVVMTENVFGIWKARFPILKNMRFSHHDAMRTVVATAVLMNFGTMERLSLDFPTVDQSPEFCLVDDRPPRQVLRAGEQARLAMVNSMVGPQTDDEWDVWY